MFNILVFPYARMFLTSPLLYRMGRVCLARCRAASDVFVGISFHPLRVGGADCARMAPWGRSLCDAGFPGCFRTAWASFTPSCMYGFCMVSVCMYLGYAAVTCDVDSCVALGDMLFYLDRLG